MADSGLSKKMKRRVDAAAAIVNAPLGYERASFKGLPAASTSLKGSFDWIQLFVQDKAALDRLAPTAARALKPGGMLWITFPKGSSGVQTDLTRDRGWDVVKKLDLKWITLISVDDAWSAFALRPYMPGEARQASR
jgi:hypothetical protein